MLLDISIETYTLIITIKYISFYRYLLYPFVTVTDFIFLVLSLLIVIICIRHDKRINVKL